MAPRKYARKPRKYARKPYKSAVRKAAGKVRRQRLGNFVKKVVTRMAEKKCITSAFTISPRCLQNSVTDITTNYYRMTPTNTTTNGWTIAQGDTSQMRTGLKVSTTSCVLNYVITPLKYDLATNPVPVPQIVRIYFFKKKNNSTNVTLSASDFIQSSGNFLESGGSTTGLSGTLIDLNRHINPENYTYLCHRTHKVGFEYYSGSGQQTTFGQMSNNDYKLNIVSSINLTKYIPKTIVFDDDGIVDSPTVYMLIQTLGADNNQFSGALNNLPIQFSAILTYKYTDL